jgi:tetratricopeptide (TPR) repeat protein
MTALKKWTFRAFGLLILCIVAAYLYGQIEVWSLGSDGERCIHISGERTADPDRSIAACTSFLDSGRNSDYWRSHMYFERALYFLDYKEDCDRALQDMNEAIKRQSDSAGFYNTRGRAHFCKGDLESAFADFTEAIHLSPTSPAIYANRARVRRLQGDYAKEQGDLAMAARLEKRNALERFIDVIRYRSIS